MWKAPTFPWDWPDPPALVFYGKHWEASLVKTYLESIGIPAQLMYEGARVYFSDFMVGPGLGSSFHVRVVVPANRSEDAQAAIEGWHRDYGNWTMGGRLYVLAYLLLIFVFVALMFVSWVLSP